MAMRRRCPKLRMTQLRPGDTATIDHLFAGLSPSSRLGRFHAPVHRLSERVRAALAAVDDTHHVALVAEARIGRRWEPVGITRLVRQGQGEAEIAIAVVDAWQGRGIAVRLLRELNATAEGLGVERLTGSILRDNPAAARLLRRAFPAARTMLLGDAIQFVVPVGSGHRDVTVTETDVLADLGVPVGA